MLKAIERAKFTAETDTRRRKSAPFIRELESQLTKNIMAQSLALQVIRNSQKPASELVQELMSIEARVGEFLGKALEEAGGKNPRAIDFRGTLAGVLSFVPMKPFRPKPVAFKLSLLKAAETALERIFPDRFPPAKNGAFQAPAIVDPVTAPVLPTTEKPSKKRAKRTKVKSGRKAGSKKKRR